jgi:hypothetical protein
VGNAAINAQNVIARNTIAGNTSDGVFFQEQLFEAPSVSRNAHMETVRLGSIYGSRASPRLALR